MSTDIQSQPHKRLFAILPAYHEAAALDKLLPRLRAVAASLDVNLTALIINDTALPDSELSRVCDANHATVLTPPYNMGSQEAVIYGVRCCVAGVTNTPPAPDDLIVTLDADGQDRPEDIPLLLHELPIGGIAVARRAGRRPEGILFSLFYSLHKLLFRILTGWLPDFGNFAAYRGDVARMVATSPHCEIVYSTALPLVAPLKRVSVARSPRLDGESKVGFRGLIDHSIRSLLPHWQTIARRTAFFSVVIGSLCLTAAMAVTILHFFIPRLTMPNWTTSVVFSALILSTQLLTLSVFLFLTGSLSRQVAVSAIWRPVFHPSNPRNIL